MQSRSNNHKDALADLSECRALLRTGSRTFLAASRFLPESVANAACALYAFCRTADDIVDAPGSSALAVEGMRDRLALIYLGRPRDIAADRAFARVVDGHHIPKALPDALLEGFEWDAHGRRYDGLPQLHEYAARVAGSVGAMMALIMDAADAQSVARACDLGVAMQLTNIARDVGEDARLGRLYLPLSWLAEAGIDADRWLLQPVHDQRVAAVVKRLLAEASGLYARAAAGVAMLPIPCQPAIETARVLYREIGQEVARRHYDSISSRAVVSRSRKCQIAFSTLLTLPFRRQGAELAPLEATRFLVEATRTTPSVSLAVSQEAPISRAQWLMELFMRLEERDGLPRRFDLNRRATYPGSTGSAR